MNIHPTRTSAHASIVLLLAFMLLAVVPLGAAADETPSTPPELGLTPADRPGSWFDLELDAGASESLAVELANHGDQTVAVVSYAADAYTLIGGGMGVGLRDEPTAGTTSWIDYPTQTIELAPLEAARRTVTVTVPHDAAPGQYLAALVIENDQPLTSDGEITIDQVVRHAVAVNITVPGPAAPALSVGTAEHTLVGGRSVARLEIVNSGNRHLEPTGTLTLTDDTGDTLAMRDVELDSVYAGTSTHLELVLDELLQPGVYTIATDLADPDHGIDASGAATFEVFALPATANVPGLDRIIDAYQATGLPVWFAPAATALLIALIVLLIVGRRRRATRTYAAPSASRDQAIVPAVPAMPATSAPWAPATSTVASPIAVAAVTGIPVAAVTGTGRAVRFAPRGRDEPRAAASSPPTAPRRVTGKPGRAAGTSARVRRGQPAGSGTEPVLFTAHSPARPRRRAT